MKELAVLDDGQVIEFREERRGGQHLVETFANGYGASVINDGYGGEDGLYEVAVLGVEGHITYATPVTLDVVGWLDADGVREIFTRIAALPGGDGHA